MYRITFLDEEHLYHTFCMEGSETHVCQLDKDLGHDEGCAGYGQTASWAVTRCEALFWSMSISFGIARGDLY